MCEVWDAVRSTDGRTGRWIKSRNAALMYGTKQSIRGTNKKKEKKRKKKERKGKRRNQKEEK